ncbi:MAG: DUF58 domain-containing protein [Bacteroidia bacterium]
METTSDKIIQTGNLELLARQVVEGFITGLHKSPFHGFSVEFAEHRQYNTGESTRHIDWKLYARTDKVFVKRYEEETNLRCQIIIDCSSSMYFPTDQLSKIRFSIQAAASLIHLLRKQRDASGITLIDDSITFHSACRSGNLHLKMLMQKLEQLLKASPKLSRSNLTESLHRVSEMIHKRSLVIIFSDMLQNTGDDQQLFAALQHLRYNKHEVILFHVEDKKTEIDFDYSNRPYLFTDSETGEKLKIFPSQVREQYLKNLEEFRHALKLRCAQYKIDLVEAEVGDDYAKILLPFLVKRSKMF